MNGVFDNKSNRIYNNIKPNYDVDDGVDNVVCNSNCEGCSYKDIQLNRCLFETCIMKQFPFSIPFHSKFTNRCKLCERTITHTYDDVNHPFVDTNPICNSCLKKLKKLLELG